MLDRARSGRVPVIRRLCQAPGRIAPAVEAQPNHADGVTCCDRAEPEARRGANSGESSTATRRAIASASDRAMLAVGFKRFGAYPIRGVDCAPQHCRRRRSHADMAGGKWLTTDPDDPMLLTRSVFFVCLLHAFGLPIPECPKLEASNCCCVPPERSRFSRHRDDRVRRRPDWLPHPERAARWHESNWLESAYALALAMIVAFLLYVTVAAEHRVDTVTARKQPYVRSISGFAFLRGLSRGGCRRRRWSCCWVDGLSSGARSGRSSGGFREAVGVKSVCTCVFVARTRAKPHGGGLWARDTLDVRH